MDALIAFLVIVTLLVILGIAAVQFGAESRDGFVDDGIRPTLG